VGGIVRSPNSSSEEPRRFVVKGISSEEAMHIMLDYVYSMGAAHKWKYSPTSMEVNQDVLRLSRSFQLLCLHEHASRFLVKGLTTDNLHERLALCEEFGLRLLRELILKEVASDPDMLAAASESPEIARHPRILQELLKLVGATVASSKKLATARTVPQATSRKRKITIKEDSG